ncbi:NACHT domain-containing protein [Saccharopolyspora sp. 5N102]|uniref:NACHT domain-containing protein n=1 Tax=Saccharopolyspora sp. 5N102 TaxID=3375155 RepID=UPI0037906FCB
MLERTAVRIGHEVVKQVAKVWLGHRRAARERDSELIELLAVGVTDRFHQRKLARQLEDIGDQVALRLRPVLERESRGLPDNEVRGALDAAVDTLTAADLTDRALFAADVNPAKLARAVDRTDPHAADRAGLSEPGRVLYERVLGEGCACLLHIVRQLPEFQPRAIVELLDRVAAATERIEQVLERLPRAVPEESGGKTDHVEFTHRYLGFVSETMDRLELFGVDVRHYQPRTPVSIAYLSLSVTAAPGPEQGLSHHRGANYHAGNGEMRIEEALSNSGLILLRGEAGSGKTTLLQWVAVNSARAGFTEPLTDWNDKIPFMVSLRAYAESSLPWPEEIAAANAGPLAAEIPPGWVDRCFRSGNALLLVDGVDELTRRRRRKVRGWLAQLLSAFPEVNLVVTSRPSAAEADWLDDQGFRSLYLEPMTPSDIDAFCRRWHNAVRTSARNGAALPCAPADLADYEAALARHLDAKSHLRALATTPLLCAMLCALNLDRRKQLPPDRMKLYEAALDMLVERRDAERDIPQLDGTRLDAKTKTALLQYLAWWLTQSGRAELGTDDAAERIAFALTRLPTVDAEPETVLRYLLERSGVIREPVLGRIEFVHRTFQEYLAGKQAAEEHLTDLLVRNAHLDQWRETVVMGAGHMTPRLRGDLLTGLLDRADREHRHARRLRLVAAACLETAHSVAVEVARRVEAALNKLTPPRNKREARSLSLAGEQVLRHLPEQLDDLKPGAAAACIRTATFVSNTTALDVLARYATDPREAVQAELAAAWKYHNPEEYARRVLADAPLHDGMITVERIQHLPYLRLLNNLRETRIDLTRDEDPEDLGVFDDVPNLVSLRLNNPPTNATTVDIEPLIGHELLTCLWTGSRRLARLKPIERLTTLEALGATLPAGTTDLTFVHPLRKLYDLNLRQCGSLRSLDSLRECAPLTRLGVWEGHSLTDISALDAMPTLELLSLHEVPIRDELAEMIPALPRLDHLVLHTCPSFSDLTTIAAAPVTKLWLWSSSVRDLTPLAEMPALRDLELPHAPVTNVNPLVQLPNLKRLDLRGVPDELDLRPLADHPKPLEVWLSPGQKHVSEHAPLPNLRIKRV